MKERKLIRYRLGVSRYFPGTHPRKGTETHFVDKINYTMRLNEGCEVPCLVCDMHYDKHECKIYVPNKLHTIRANYSLWDKRFKKILAGEAVLELFYWSGKPYNSKQIVFATLTKEDGIGIQKFRVGEFYDEINSVERAYYSIDDRAKFELLTSTIAKNDGLSLEDWRAWFKGYDLSEPMAIIHFTKFRY